MFVSIMICVSLDAISYLICTTSSCVRILTLANVVWEHNHRQNHFSSYGLSGHHVFDLLVFTVFQRRKQICESQKGIPVASGDLRSMSNPHLTIKNTNFWKNAAYSRASCMSLKCHHLWRDRNPQGRVLVPFKYSFFFDN